MKITRKSPLTGKENTLEVPCTEDQLYEFQRGSLIQKAMPDVPPELREFVLTGHTPEDWAILFGSGDEE